MANNGTTAVVPEHVQRVLSTYVDHGDIPGLVMLMSHQGKTAIQATGYQSIDGPPMREDTIFRISSMTKPITAVATLILVEEGVLSLDQPVDELLPELADPRVLRTVESSLDDTVPLKRPITVRDLLTFQSGTGVVLAEPGYLPIQQAFEDNCLAIGPPNPSIMPLPDEWIRRLGSLPLLHQPKEGWMYSTGSDILGVLVARSSGLPFENFLQERIFDPLGMPDTGFFVPPEKVERFATCYGANSDTGELDVFDSNRSGQWNQPPPFAAGASGLVSTAADFERFASMLMNRGQFGDTQILQPSSVDLMTRNHLTTELQSKAEPIIGEDKGWGFGVAVRTRRGETPGSVGSYGWNGGLGTFWLNDPDRKLTAILLTQCNWSCPVYWSLEHQFLAAVYGSLDAS